jgi:hypothetical protein
MPTLLDAAWVVRVAVSGHRDLDPTRVRDVKQSVRSALGDLTRRLGPRHLELVTGMADGADGLVTDIARELGLRVHAILPKPVTEYRSELSEDALSRLDGLLTDPDVRVSTISGPSPLRSDAAQADEATPYECLGVYLARSADVLIALWDGDSERKPGGTLDVMSRHLDRRYADRRLVAPEPPRILPAPARCASGPIATWVRTTRSTGAAQPGAGLSYLVGSDIDGVWYGLDEAPPHLEDLLDEVSAVNELGDRTTSSDAYPLVDELPADASPELRTALAETHAAYLTADRLAMGSQSRSDRAFVAASLIAAAMGFCFLWFAKIHDHSGWLYGYLALFAVGYGVFRSAHRGHWLQRHLSLRALAETLRIRFFATLMGLADEVDFKGVLALSGVSSFPGFGLVAGADRIGVSTSSTVTPARLDHHDEVVRNRWVDDQAAYFGHRSHQFERRHELLETMSRSLYGLSFVAVALIIAFASEFKKVDLFGDTSSKTLIVFLMGLLPLWLTLWELHQGRMATRELLWQFRNQERLFRQASVLLDGAPSEERSRVYVELAERSLFETYMWTIHRFHREFTPPAGG